MPQGYLACLSRSGEMPGRCSG